MGMALDVRGMCLWYEPPSLPDSVQVVKQPQIGPQVWVLKQFITGRPEVKGPIRGKLASLVLSVEVCGLHPMFLLTLGQKVAHLANSETFLEGRWHCLNGWRFHLRLKRDSHRYHTRLNGVFRGAQAVGFVVEYDEGHVPMVSTHG